MPGRDEILIILNNIQEGRISPEEGLALMNSLSSPDPENLDLPIDQPVDGVDVSTNDEVSVSAESQSMPPEIIAQPAVDEIAPDEVTTVDDSIEPSHLGTNGNGHIPSNLIPQTIEITGSPADETQRGTPTPDRVTGEPVGEKDAEREIQYWKSWWLWPFWIGTGLTFFGALIMYLGYEAAHFGFFFWFAWIPFFLGVIIVAISWQNRMVHWLHVRVHQKPGDKPGTISISLPLPIGIMTWFLHNFSHFIPGLNNQKINGNDIGDILSELGKNVTPDNPFYVHVNGDNGEEVEVFIG